MKLVRLESGAIVVGPKRFASMRFFWDASDVGRFKIVHVALP